MSRSVTVAVVYVMCVTSLSWRDALKVVRGARNVANPNVGFLKQLQDFESDRMAEVSSFKCPFHSFASSRCWRYGFRGSSETP